MCHYLSHQDSSAAQERGYLVLGIAARIALAVSIKLQQSLNVILIATRRWAFVSLLTGL